MAPDTLEHARSYFERNRLPFPCLADPERRVFRLYDVQSRLVSLGQRPALFVIDPDGVVRWAHADRDYKVRPSLSQILAAFDRLQLHAH